MKVVTLLLTCLLLAGCAAGPGVVLVTVTPPPPAATATPERSTTDRYLDVLNPALTAQRAAMADMTDVLKQATDKPALLQDAAWRADLDWATTTLQAACDVLINLEAPPGHEGVQAQVREMAQHFRSGATLGRAGILERDGAKLAQAQAELDLGQRGSTAAQVEIVKLMAARQ